MSTTGPSPTPVADAAHTTAFVLLDLGKQKPKAVKRLRKGQGQLLEDVLSTIDELKTAGTIAQTAQPVLILVREKSETVFPTLAK